MWFQYVVGYDKQEQRSLATSLHNRLFDYRRSLSRQLDSIQKALPGFVNPLCDCSANSVSSCSVAGCKKS